MNMKPIVFLAAVSVSVAAYAVPPTIHVAWDETPAPTSPEDYIIFGTDPDYPENQGQTPVFVIR